MIGRDMAGHDMTLLREDGGQRPQVKGKVNAKNTRELACSGCVPPALEAWLLARRSKQGEQQ